MADCNSFGPYKVSVRILRRFEVPSNRLTCILQEIDEVLELLQSTWRILGVTRAVHDVCLAWVLFKQFVVTGNSDLLSTVASHLKKMVSDGGQSAQVRLWKKSFL